MLHFKKSSQRARSRSYYSVAGWERECRLPNLSKVYVAKGTFVQYRLYCKMLCERAWRILPKRSRAAGAEPLSIEYSIERLLRRARRTSFLSGGYLRDASEYILTQPEPWLRTSIPVIHERIIEQGESAVIMGDHPWRDARSDLAELWSRAVGLLGNPVEEEFIPQTGIELTIRAILANNWKPKLVKAPSNLSNSSFYVLNKDFRVGWIAAKRLSLINGRD